MDRKFQPLPNRFDDYDDRRKKTVIIKRKQTAQSGAQTQRKQTQEKETNVKNTSITRRNQTAQSGAQTQRPPIPGVREVIPVSYSIGRTIPTPIIRRPSEVLHSQRDNLSIINRTPAIATTRTTSMPSLQTVESGIQTQRKQTAEASASINTPFVMRKPQTVQSGMYAGPLTSQSGMYAGPESMTDAWATVAPKTKQKGLTADTKPKTKVKGVDTTKPKTKVKGVEARPNVTYRKTGPDTSIPVFAQMGIQARPQTAQMGIFAGPQAMADAGINARPQTAQMGLNARPQTAQMGLNARPQTAQMGIFAGPQGMADAGIQVSQPSIFESLGNLFGLNLQQQSIDPQYVEPTYDHKNKAKIYKNSLKNLKITQLRNKAKESQLYGYSRANKKELINMNALNMANRQTLNLKKRNCLGKKELNSDYTVAELKKAATKLNISGTSKLRKNELCNILHYYDKIQDENVDKTREFLNKIYERKNLIR